MSGSALRIGVAGAGNIASIAQLPTLVARDDVELRALVTRQDNPQPLMRRWGFRSAYPTVEAMLSAEELDALFVLTPRSEHVHATRLALEAGVDVFCEKPLATSAADAQSLALGRRPETGAHGRFQPPICSGIRSGACRLL
jgi:virulence factor